MLLKLISDCGVSKVSESGRDVYGHQEVLRQEDGGRREGHEGRCSFYLHFKYNIVFHILVQCQKRRMNLVKVVR